MSKNTNSRAARMTVAGIAGLAAYAMPAIALADGKETGMKLLLPQLTEFIPALIAFIIIWVILAKLGWPMILKMMDDREAKIKNDIESAEQSKLNAAESEKVAASKIADAQREADEIIAAARREAEKERAEIIAKAQEDASEILSRARDAVESERKKAMIELSGSVVDLSVDIAGKIIGDGMDVSTQRSLAEKYLAEVGSLNA